jgi:HlyD family secretion protein
MLNLDKPASVNQTLNLDEPIKKRGYQFFLLIFIALLLGAFALKLLLFKNAENKITKFETVPVKRGDLTVTVMATGKLEPVTQVDIGIEVSGTVAEIYADFNDHVTAGQVLAKLDTRIFESRVKQSQGALDQALARLIDAQATIAEKKQALSFMQQARQLSGGSVPAKQDIVTAQANLKRAYAQENLIKGAIAQASGQLKLDD